jgi:single-strand DNA-binding protein
MTELAKNQSVAFAGHLGSDPKLAKTDSGDFVANMSVAFTPRIRQGDEWVNGEPVWYSVSAFKGLAEHAAASFHKGDLVMVIGRQNDVEYDRRDGSKGVDHRVTADEIGASVRFAEVDIHPIARSIVPSLSVVD